jgi:hypothetical protein
VGGRGKMLCDMELGSEYHAKTVRVYALPAAYELALNSLRREI